MKQYIAPSIICGDLLNLEKEIDNLNRAHVDLIHFDIMDSTFSPMDQTTALQPDLIPLIRQKTNIPLDIHIEIVEPIYLLQAILPYCKDCYVQVHIECCSKINHYINVIKNAGAHPAIALNSGTSLSLIDEVIENVELIDLCTTNNRGMPHLFDKQIRNKIQKTRLMADKTGKDIIVEVDGGISFEIAKKCKELGANCYVLGTKSIYKQEYPVYEMIDKFRNEVLGE